MASSLHAKSCRRKTGFKVIDDLGMFTGTGGAVARKFAKEGFAVGLVSRSSKSSQPAYDQITSDGGKALIVTADTGM